MSTLPTSGGTNLINYIPSPILDVSTLSNPCSSIDGKYVIRTGYAFWPAFKQNFTQQCGLDFPGTSTAGVTGPLYDTVSIIAYTMDDCITACFNVNMWSAFRGESVVCGAVSWIQRNVAAHTKSYGANCYLKNSIPKGGAAAGKVSPEAVVAWLS